MAVREEPAEETEIITGTIRSGLQITTAAAIPSKTVEGMTAAGERGPDATASTGTMYSLTDGIISDMADVHKESPI